MTYEELQILVQNNEHHQLELKKTTGELKDSMHSACAFLNTEGGWLVFGVTPASLKILGQEVTDISYANTLACMARLSVSFAMSGWKFLQRLCAKLS